MRNKFKDIIPLVRIELILPAMVQDVNMMDDKKVSFARRDIDAPSSTK